MLEKKQLDRFGQFLIAHFRDSIIENFHGIVWHSVPTLCVNRKLMMKLTNEFNLEQKKIIEELITECIDSTLSSFLWEIQTSKDESINSGISILVDDVSITKTDVHLQSLLDNDEGWIEKFSKYKDFDSSNEADSREDLEQ
jgi:hypothetical protein